uniref:Lipocalin n=1 Tax=Rhipicephalus zambeziensis TaxID=60191 RepID=A0A224YB86_9ACAR
MAFTLSFICRKHRTIQNAVSTLSQPFRRGRTLYISVYFLFFCTKCSFLLRKLILVPGHATGTMLLILLSLALPQCMLGAGVSDPRGNGNNIQRPGYGFYLPYEENPQHFDEQLLRDLTDINEPIFIKMRNYETNTPYRCHYAQKVGQMYDGSFWYNLNIRAPTRAGYQYVTFPNIAIPLRTGQHLYPNALWYRFTPAHPAALRKILTINRRLGCAVLVEQLRDGRRGCQLVQTSSTVDYKVPPQCQRAYDENCKGNSVTLYEPSCKVWQVYFPQHGTKV